MIEDIFFYVNQFQVMDPVILHTTHMLPDCLIIRMIYFIDRMLDMVLAHLNQ